LHNKDINFNFENSIILDIFSGSGSFGIECLSRGSAKVFFVEKNTKAIEVLEKNISSINSKDKCEIINKDILHIDLSNLLHTRVNLIFLDPPFNYELWNELIKKIYLLKKKSPECIIITHQEVKKNIRLDQYLNILLQKKYGVSLINFARFKL
jgi:16S rRNA (guanine966-N2)-methyltransferase